MSNKKNFKGNPTAFFISEQEPAAPEPARAASVADFENIPLPIGYKIVQESKTRRIQLLLRPSVYEVLKRVCDDEGLSVNQKINQIIEAYLTAQEGE